MDGGTATSEVRPTHRDNPKSVQTWSGIIHARWRSLPFGQSKLVSKAQRGPLSETPIGLLEAPVNRAVGWERERRFLPLSRDRPDARQGDMASAKAGRYRSAARIGSRRSNPCHTRPGRGTLSVAREGSDSPSRAEPGASAVSQVRKRGRCLSVAVRANTQPWCRHGIS